VANKRSYHVDPYYKGNRRSTQFCNEPQALVNVCLTCPLPKCRPYNCKRYETAKIRFEFKVFPLVDVVEVVQSVKRCKCQDCEFGADVGGKVFCPLVECVKEDRNEGR
jgi:hypothetical protein